jgi:hypothetical protein
MSVEAHSKACISLLTTRLRFSHVHLVPREYLNGMLGEDALSCFRREPSLTNITTTWLTIIVIANDDILLRLKKALT